MKVLLVRPRPDAETIGLQHVMLVEPLELEVLAALCRPEHEPVVVDLALETEPFGSFLERERPDVVGVTGYITNIPAMIALCREAKAFDPEIATVVGGVHVEVCPRDLDDAAVDYRVVRNPVTGFGPLLAHVEGRGSLPPGVLRPGEVVAPMSLPAIDFAYVKPDRSTVAKYRDRYFYVFHQRVALLKTAFGCPFKCSFCFCRQITEGKFRERTLEDVLDELEELPEREIYIVDDDFLVSVERLRAFMAGVRARKIDKHYLVYGRADFIAKHPELMAELRDVGLRTVIIGFESFIDGELDGYDKQTTVTINREAGRVMQRLGLTVYATLILSPSWTRAEFDATARAGRELGLRFVNLQPLTPLPGTGAVVLDHQLVIDRRDYPRWDLAHVTVRPSRMSVAQYYREIIRLYQKMLFRPRYLVGYLKYHPRTWWKMMVGSYRVRQQYLGKLAEAECRSSS